MSESDTMLNEPDRRCAAVQLMLSTDPSYDNRTIASTLKMQIRIHTNNRDVPWVMKTKFLDTVMIFGVVSSEGHIMPTHNLRVGLKFNTKVYLYMLKSVGIPWCNQVVGSRPWVWQQDSAPVQRDLGLASEGVLRFWSLLSLPPPPRPDPAGLLRLFIRREHHQHYLPQHQSQPDRNHAPSIRRAPAGACGKGMLPVSHPYRGSDWGWRRLHWIDVSCTTESSYLNWFFQ